MASYFLCFETTSEITFSNKGDRLKNTAMKTEKEIKAKIALLHSENDKLAKFISSVGTETENENNKPFKLTAIRHYNKNLSLMKVLEWVLEK